MSKDEAAVSGGVFGGRRSACCGAGRARRSGWRASGLFGADTAQLAAAGSCRRGEWQDKS